MKEYTLDGMAALVRLLSDEYKLGLFQIGTSCVQLSKKGSCYLIYRSKDCKDYSIRANMPINGEKPINVKINELVV